MKTLILFSIATASVLWGAGVFAGADSAPDSTVLPAKSCQEIFSQKAINLQNLASQNLISRIDKLSQNLESEKLGLDIQIRYLRGISALKVVNFFNGAKSSSHVLDGNILRLNVNNSAIADALTDQIIEYFRELELFYKLVSRKRKLVDEEKIEYELIRHFSKFTKKNEKWVASKILILPQLLEKDSDLDIGTLSQVLLIDYVTEKIALLDENALSEGQIKGLNSSKRLAKVKEFLVDRALKKYSGNLLWWGPVYLVYQFGDDVMTFVTALFQ